MEFFLRRNNQSLYLRRNEEAENNTPWDYNKHRPCYSWEQVPARPLFFLISSLCATVEWSEALKWVNESNS